MHSSNEDRTKKIHNLENLFNEGNMQIVIKEARALIKKYNSGVAFNILALAYKRLGNYDQSLSIFEKLLVKNPKNTLFLGNLGNIYSDMGQTNKAENCFLKCLEIDPKNYSVSLNLGNLYSATAKLDSALIIFNNILQDHENLTKAQRSNINYRIAELYRQKGIKFFDKAIYYYNLSDHPLSDAHRLELIYRIKDRSIFFQEEEKIRLGGNLNPLLAAIQTHASFRYDKPDTNLFCKKSFEYIEHSQLTHQEGFTEDLITKLLEVKSNLDYRPQALLKNGEQSAGNFLLSSEPSILLIKNIILNRIAKYRNDHSNSNEGFIKYWPKNATLHGWIIELKKGGSLGSHMHKLGWLSGSLYLKHKKLSGQNQGNIVFDLHGANYPKDAKEFPNKEFNIRKGDIILFPSSIFHRTIPFAVDDDRITLAFDIKPVY
jgi:tetratricopeptide (TPR) repeat protein